jgi:hypothetical protein
MRTGAILKFCIVAFYLSGKVYIARQTSGIHFSGIIFGEQVGSSFSLRNLS